MGTGAAGFAGRRDVQEAYARLVGADRDGSVLVVWGNPGQGKTALVRHLADGPPAGARVLDLEELADWRIGSGSLPDIFLDTVCGELAEFLAAANPRWLRRWRLAAYRRAARGARRGDGMSASITASRDSRITGAVINVGASPDGVRARLAHRAELRAALLRLARGVGSRRRVLLIDSSERLDQLDALADSGSWENCGFGVRHWFVNELVTGLLEAAPSLRLVLAGRDQPRLPEGLASEVVELGGLSADETAELLASRGLDDPDTPGMIHARCDGNPLWILLVATLVPVSGTDELAGLIRRNEHVPLTDWVLESFLERLPDAMREVVLAAAVPRVLDEETIRKLARTPGRLPRNWYAQLRAYSFMRPSGRGSTPRMYDMVRRSVLRYLTAEDPGRLRESHRIASAHFRERDDLLEWAYHGFANGDDEPAAWWRSAVRSAYGLGSLDQVERLAELLLAPEHERVAEERLPSLTAEAMTHAATVALAHGHDADADASLDRAASLCSDAADRAGLARVSLLMAHLAYLRADYARSGRLLETAGDMYRETVDDRGAARVRLMVASVALQVGDEERAAEVLRFALAECRRCDDRLGTALCLRRLAAVEMRQENLATAETYLVRAGELFDELGDSGAAAWTSLDWADLLAAGGDREAATRRVQEACRYFEESGDEHCLAHARHQLAGYALDRFDFPAASALLASAGDTFEAMSHRDALAAVLCSHGAILAARGDYKRAEKYLRRALEIYTDLGRHPDSAHAAVALARYLSARGRWDEAEELLVRARDTFAARTAERELSRTLLDLGEVALARGKYQRAEGQLRQARAGMEKCGDRVGSAEVTMQFGWLEIIRGHYRRAEDLLARARAVFTDAGARLHLASVAGVEGQLALSRGDPEAAMVCIAEARERYAELGVRPGFAQMLLQLSRIALDRHDHARAVDFARQARQIFAELRDSAGLAETIEVLGDLSHDRCEFEDATIFYAETRGRYHQLGDHRREAEALCKAAGSSASVGRFAAARAKCRQAIDLFRRLGLHDEVRWVERMIADIEQIERGHDPARLRPSSKPPRSS